MFTFKIDGDDYGRNDMRLAYWSCCLSEVIPWFEGMVFDGLTVKRQEEGFLLIVRATRGGKGKVAFFAGHDQLDCFRAFANAINHECVVWKDDKWKV